MICKLLKLCTLDYNRCFNFIKKKTNCSKTYLKLEISVCNGLESEMNKLATQLFTCKFNFTKQKDLHSFFNIKSVYSSDLRKTVV